jgi:rhodanese-related sulfurtransferase
LNKRYLMYFAAVFLVLLIIAPGMAASDKCTEKCTYTTVSICDARRMIEDGDVFILDVRTPAEYDLGHIEGATLIPVKNTAESSLDSNQLLTARMKELPQNRCTKILVYCKFGGRSAEASDLLVEAGYTNVYNMDNDADSKNKNGGITQWVREGYPIVATFKAWENEWCQYLSV